MESVMDDWLAVRTLAERLLSLPYHSAAEAEPVRVLAGPDCLNPPVWRAQRAISWCIRPHEVGYIQHIR